VSPGDFVNDDDFVVFAQCSIAINYLLLFMKLINHKADLSVLILLDNYIFIPIDFYSIFMFPLLVFCLYFQMSSSLYILTNDCQHED
jgi:hypothetical protein